MYYIVYDESGKMFEVTANKARALLDSGWTATFPEDLSNVFSSHVDETTIPEPDEAPDQMNLFGPLSA